MKKGNIIFLNGITSTGKTTLAKEIQKQADVNYYHISYDMFQQMISMKFLEKDYWKYLSEAIITMYETVKLLSDNGNSIIIDGMLLEIPEFNGHYQKVIDIFTDYPLLMVEVYCSLDECKKRNIERGDRKPEQSEEQIEIMANGVKYDISVSTYNTSSEQCAKQILSKIMYS